MFGRRLALLLLVYVSLDFANPFMPGAVSFESGFVEAAGADRQRPAGATVATASAPRNVPVLAPERPLPPARPGTVRRRIHPPAGLETRSLDPPSPAEDH